MSTFGRRWIKAADGATLVPEARREARLREKRADIPMVGDAIVIVHKELGVFVGSNRRYAAWSRINAVGSESVSAFSSKSAAETFLKTATGGGEIDEFSFVEVRPDTKEGGCSVAALRAAGIDEDTLGELPYARHWQTPGGRC